MKDGYRLIILVAPTSIRSHRKINENTQYCLEKRMYSNITKGYGTIREILISEALLNLLTIISNHHLVELRTLKPLCFMEFRAEKD